VKTLLIALVVGAALVVVFNGLGAWAERCAESGGRVVTISKAQLVCLK
jgi:hypothetical protein